jgi:hypothetical protein
VCYDNNILITTRRGIHMNIIKYLANDNHYSCSQCKQLRNERLHGKLEGIFAHVDSTSTSDFICPACREVSTGEFPSGCMRNISAKNCSGVNNFSVFHKGKCEKIVGDWKKNVVGVE